MASQFQSPEILVVEDSPTQALQLRRLFETHGYTVRTAANGPEALAALETRLPAMVLSDVVMPDMDGYELCRRIKADERFRGIPVVILTVLSDPRDIITGLQSGADNFLVKPWEEKPLLARVRQILANRELRDAGIAQFGIDVMFHGEKHRIHAERLQILDLLLATYEAATQQSAELHRAKEEAENANRAKTELLARVAQEMRTPLNAILGFGQLLKLESLGAEHDESVRHIMEGGEHLLRLTTEMLDLSRIENGCLSLSREAVAIDPVIAEGLNRLRPLAHPRRLQIRWDRRPGNGRQVVANRERLSEILWNLLSNAVKYNKEGGSIVISENETADGALRIKIADTGMGIAPEDLQYLFVPFERLGAEKRGIDGSGLGLALARRLAEVMGGIVGVESTLGVGSVFWLQLPLHPAKAVGAALK
ncbi:MAG TPA: hybrid sensor histidine kinase/response regulator [Chthoniobacteraceae bacterium]|jgi:signal transduction histidine kinase